MHLDQPLVSLVRIGGGWYKLCGEQQHSSLIPRPSHVHAALCQHIAKGKKAHGKSQEKYLWIHTFDVN